LTSEKNNPNIPNQTESTNQNNNQETPYYQTQEYQDKMFQFIKETKQQNFKKDKSQALHKARNARYSPNLQFSPENVQMWLQNPMMNEARLRDFSNFLYDTNALYRWVITTLANMPTWAWTLSMKTHGSRKAPDKVERVYRQGLEYLHNKNIKSEMHKAFLIAIKQDFYYGYEVQGDDYYFVLNLDPNYCRISRQVGDGIYGFQFNFAFFDSKLDIEETSQVINSYPPEFKRKYVEYSKGNYNSSWIDLDIDNTICLKMNDEILHGIPYFANLFPLLVDLGFYKDLARERAEIDNFLLLHQKIPLDEKEFNKFAIDLGLAKSFDAIADGTLPDGVRMFTSPMDVTAVKTERSNKDNNNVKEALSQVYTGAGIPQALSNNDSVAGLNKAIMVNEQIVYRFYRQVEKIYNYKLKNKFISTKFQMRIQDITNFNKEEKVDSLLKIAQNGIGSPIAVASASGVNPYEFMNDVDLEYDVLGLTHKLRPLQTSHTMSGNDVEAHVGGVGNEGGAPTKDDGELSDAGVQTREIEANTTVE